MRNATGVYVQGGATAATARLTGNLVARNANGIQTGANGAILTPLSNTIKGKCGRRWDNVRNLRTEMSDELMLNSGAR